MKGLILRSLIIGSIISSLFPSNDVSNVQEIAPGTYMWTITQPEQGELVVGLNGVELGGWNTTINSHGLKIPVLSKLAYTLHEEPRITITGSNWVELEHELHFTPLKEQVKGMKLEGIDHPAAEVREEYHLEFLGKTGAYSLWSVSIFGARVDSHSDRLQVRTGQIAVQIQVDHSDNIPHENREIYLNKPLTKQSLGKTSNQGLGAGKVKLHVLRDGIYRIYYEDIKDLDGVEDQSISSQSLRLFNRGEEQAMFVSDGRDGVFDSGDFFDFLGEQNYFSGATQYYDPFSDVNVYWLDWGGAKGRRFIEESGALVSANPVQPTSFWDMAHLEKDNIFDRLGRVDTDKPTITRDHYFWSSVNSGQNVEVDFFLPDPARGSSENIDVEIGLHGLTYSEGSGPGGEHTIYAFINDNSVGSASWTQQEEYTLIAPSSLNLSHNILASSGSNILEVFAPVSAQAGVHDRVVLNWLRVGYERLLSAHGDRLRFRKSHLNPATNLEFELSGFTSPNLVIYKESLSKITGYQIREVWDSHGQTFNLVFQDEVSDATPDYWTSTVDSLLSPAHSIADTLADLRSQDGNFIIITTPGLAYEFDEYLEFKRTEGWDPVVVSLSDIADEFNYGIKSPYAIKSFLSYAKNHWPSDPTHVLLVGDASIDPQSEKQDVQLSNVPTFYMQTYGWGAAEADYWYTLINGDDYVPDLSIGRLPVGDREELQMTLQKLIRYQDAQNGFPCGSWQNEIITIAGFETTFKNQSENLLNTEVPDGTLPSRVFIDRNSEGDIFWGDTDSLIDLWNDGKLLINFLGHGGGAVWADRSLFVREDVDLLEEETPPALVTSMTCFTGSFAQTEGLGEVVLTGSPTGAIGWLGSSGVGWLINDYLMIQPMMRRLLEEDRTVGEIMNTARIEYFIAPAATASDGTDLRPSMLFQYNYLGDPTTRLRLPEKSDLFQSAKNIYNQTEQIKIQNTGGASGELTLLPVNSYGKPWWTHPETHSVTGSETIQIDQEPVLYNADSSTIIQPAQGSGRIIYTLDRGPDLSALQGHVPYGINAQWFEHEPLTANELASGSPFTLRTRLHSESGQADSVVIQFSGGASEAFTMILSGGWWETPSQLSIAPNDSKTYYHFIAFSNGEELLRSNSYRLFLPQALKLKTQHITEAVRGNRVGVEIHYTLEGVDSSSAQLTYTDSSVAFQQNFTKTVALSKGNNALFVPSYFGLGPVRVFAELKADRDTNAGDDSVRATIGTSHYQILPGKGVSFDGVNGDTLILWNADELTVDAPDTAWMKIQDTGETISGTAGIAFSSSETAYDLSFSSSAVTAELGAGESLFMKHPQIDSWQLLDSENGKFSLLQNGLLARGQRVSTTGPDVSLMIEGQLFFDGDYITRDARVDLMGEDEDGFTWIREDIELLINDAPVDVVLGDTTQEAKIIAVTGDLQLDPGSHDISFRMRDALNNWSEISKITAIVAEDARILDYGNFPNPFQGETQIIYELTQPLEDVKIEIFTLAGYKIITIDEFDARVGISLGAIGYHEVPWNGRDRHDDFVANGVYFYRIRGELDGEILYGPVGKMVKNR